MYVDPAIIYEAQFTAGTPAVSFIGNKYTLSTTAGSTNNGRSKEGVTATTSSGVALCVGFVDSQAIVLVLPQEPSLRSQLTHSQSRESN